MKIYFLCEDNDQLGPFSINQLRQKGINQDTLIWKEGFTGWVKAGDVDGLKNILPPPIIAKSPVQPQPYIAQVNKGSHSEKAGFKMSRSAGWMSLIILIVALFGFIVYRKQGPTPETPLISSLSTPVIKETLVKEKKKEKKPIDKKATLSEKEKQNPSQYLLSNTSMRKNLVSEKVFEGTITNKASMTIYKDVVLQVQFLSKTDGKIGSEKFTIHEIIPPRQKIKFKFKTHSPAGTKGFRAGVIDANTIE